MKGLIKYDLMQIANSLKGAFIIVYVAFLVGFCIFNESSFAFVIIFISSIFGISTFTWEETYHWNRYAATLPVSDRRIVLARYGTFGFCILFGFGIGCLLSAISSIVRPSELSLFEWFVSILIMSVTAIIYVEIITPCMYRFGSERGRIVVLVVLVLIAALIFGAMSLIGTLNFDTNLLFSFMAKYGIIILILLPVILFPISFSLSVKFYSKKEF